MWACTVSKNDAEPGVVTLISIIALSSLVYMGIIRGGGGGQCVCQDPQAGTQNFWQPPTWASKIRPPESNVELHTPVAFKELNLSYYVGEILFFAKNRYMPIMVTQVKFLNGNPDIAMEAPCWCPFCRAPQQCPGVRACRNIGLRV